MTYKVQVKFNTSPVSPWPSFSGIVTYIISQVLLQYPGDSQVGTEGYLQVNYSSGSLLLCQIHRKCFFPSTLYAFPPHSLHTLSLLLNKSFPALNPVRIEKLLLSWRMFFQPAWQWLWRAQIQSNELVNSDGGNRALWDLLKETGYLVFFPLSGWGNKGLWSKDSCLPTYCMGTETIFFFLLM